MNRCKRKRLSLRMTQVEVAKAARVTQGLYSRIESGRVASPGIQTCYRIAKALRSDVRRVFPIEKRTKEEQR